MVVQSQQTLPFGFTKGIEHNDRPLEFKDLWNIYEATPGLVLDKLKAAFAHVSKIIQSAPILGVIFAYDEAQNLSDHAAANEYPLSLLLDLFSTCSASMAIEASCWS
jgi:hypothetical protein